MLSYYLVCDSDRTMQHAVLGTCSKWLNNEPRFTSR